jgi:Amt family ammonium transporter
VGANLYDIHTPLLVGAVGGALVVFAIPLFDKLKLDDPVGALSVHLVNGIWGTLAVGIFVNKISFFDQLKGVAVIGVFTFVVSYIVIYSINKLIPFRAENDMQVQGMDVVECGVEAYPEFRRAI